MNNDTLPVIIAPSEELPLVGEYLPLTPIRLQTGSKNTRFERLPLTHQLKNCQMKKMSILLLLGAVCIAFISFSPTHTPSAEMPYPEGYRKWTHIKTEIIGPDNPAFKTFGGFHHIYANEKAMTGYETGHFPEGSVIVFDVLEALKKDNSDTYEGKRRHIDVMVKDSSKYAATGGWGFDEFKGDSKTERNITPAMQTQCFKCHATQKDLIFSTWRP